MKKQIIILSVLFLFLVSGITIIIIKPQKQKALPPLFSDSPSSIGSEEDPNARANYELMRLRDPATGRIPENIRAKELAFAKTLPKDDDFISANGKSPLNWTARGPWNVGGRTRAMAIDVTDENTILAGSVSGGIWRTTNGGNTWTKVSTQDQNFGATCIVQDTRPSKTHIWYIGSGEAYGTSASGSLAFYLGNGVYKSTDGGITWNSLTATANPTPNSFTSNWNLIWNMEIDPSDTTQDEVYAATYGKIFRSTDGGATWSVTLGGANNNSYFTDIAITSTGILYVTLSSDGNTKGIFRSPDGITWTNITSVNWPPEYDRVVIGISPSNENDIYFFSVTPGYGNLNQFSSTREEWTSLWKYTYLSGDGSGSGGKWIDRSQNIPSTGGRLDKFNAQGSYNLLIRVKPNDTSVVFIGGTNIYRSTDAFKSDSNTTHIGGYAKGTSLPDYQQYNNHHPDQHDIKFFSSNPNIMISASDGGVVKTLNCMADTVEWISLNNGYLTSQFYTVAIDNAATNDNLIVGGLQDNGSYFGNSADVTATWNMSSKGDGSYCAIEDGHDYFYFSKQNGKMVKSTLDNSGNPTAFRRIDPIGGKNYLFINPYILDPNDNKIMYLAGGKSVWRNDDLSQIVLDNSWDSISTNWHQLIDTLSQTDVRVTAIAASKNPANRLYFGTNRRSIYRIDNANMNNHYVPSDITPVIQPPYPPVIFPGNGNISCIVIDPRDADKVLVVFSNYNVFSLFYTGDGGNNWKRASGNLEEDPSSGGGTGPSCRWASILPVGNKTAYVVATSTGVYATDTLRGDSTIWVQQSSSMIGNSVVDMIKTRESDGFIVAVTHGNGIFTTNITNINQIAGVNDNYFHKDNAILSVFPNPVQEKSTIRYFLPGQMYVRLRIFDLNGKMVTSLANKIQDAGFHEMTFKAGILSKGIYFCNLKTSSFSITKRIVIVR